MLLVSYECSRSFAARVGAFAGALSTGWAAPGLAVARRTAALAGGLTGCAAGCIAIATTTAATAATAATTATAAGTSLPTRAGKLSHRFAACLATTTLIGRLSAHVPRLHQAFLVEPDQIQATGLRERLYH